MNETMQHGQLDVRFIDQLSRISPTAFQDAAKIVQMLGCSMEQAAEAFKACGEAANILKAETEMLRPRIPERPWYRRGRW